MKAYKVIGNIEGIEKDDLFLFDSTSNTYFLSRVDSDSTEDGVRTEEVFVSLPAALVESDSSMFEKVELEGYFTKEISQPVEAKEDASPMKSKEEVVEKLNSIESTLTHLEESLINLDVTDADTVYTIIEGLRKEYWLLQWILNIK